jgi:hypothetical protein
MGQIWMARNPVNLRGKIWTLWVLQLEERREQDGP